MDKAVTFFSDPAQWAGETGTPNRLLQHLYISGSSVLLALLVAIPIGLYIGHTNRGSSLAINLANIGRAIPSYAMMVIPLPLTISLAPVIGFDPTFGLTFLPIFLAMTFLAIPPLLVGTYAGLRSVDRDLIESGRGMGLSERQILGRIEIPLASSIIVGGLRTATLQVIATATIGAILVAGLAIGVDLVLAQVQRRLTPRALRAPRRVGAVGPPSVMDEPDIATSAPGAAA
jgi:osmoprotectant transport system permease protein